MKSLPSSKHAARNPDNRPRVEAAIGWLAAFGFIFLAGITALFALQSYNRALTTAEERAQAAVRVLAEHAARLFDAADLLVEYAAQETAGLDWSEIESSRSLWDRLNGQRMRLPFLDAVWLNDASGMLRFSTVAFPAPPSDASDREPFRFHKAGSNLPFISERIIGRVTGKPSFLLSRRLSDPDGRFRGMASVTVDPAYLSGFYRDLDLPYAGQTMLVRSIDLGILVREPEPTPLAPAALGETIRQALAVSPKGGVIHDGSVLIAHRSVDNWPVLVAIQHEIEPVVAAWRRSILPYAAIAAAAAAALLALSIFGFRQAQAARRMQTGLEQRVRERTASLEQTLSERDGLLVEKDLLMREVHHRVKNSLQMVSSLMALHGQAAGDAAVKNHLEEARTRIQAISDIHQLLYRGEDVRVVPFHDYLEALCRDLERSALGSDPAWQLELALEEVEIPTDQAIPLGLIANELVMNTVKHAYRDAPVKPISVSFGRHESDAVELSVGDHGVGMPAGFDWRKSRSLGMRLIHALSNQLNATLTVADRRPGSRFTIRVPLQAPTYPPPEPPVARNGTSARPTEQRRASPPQ